MDERLRLAVELNVADVVDRARRVVGSMNALSPSLVANVLGALRDVAAVARTIHAAGADVAELVAVAEDAVVARLMPRNVRADVQCRVAHVTRTIDRIDAICIDGARLWGHPVAQTAARAASTHWEECNAGRKEPRSEDPRGHQALMVSPGGLRKGGATPARKRSCRWHRRATRSAHSFRRAGRRPAPR